MTSLRWRWRPLTDTVWLLVALVTITMVISLHLGNRLLWFRSRQTSKLSQSSAQSPFQWSSPTKLTKVTHRNGQKTIDQNEQKSFDRNDLHPEVRTPIGKLSTGTLDLVNVENSIEQKDHGNEFQGRNFASKNRAETLPLDGLQVANTFILSPTEVVGEKDTIPPSQRKDTISPSQRKDTEISSYQQEALDSFTTLSEDDDRPATHVSRGSTLTVLHDRLSQIEAPLLPPSPNNTYVMVQGSRATIQQHLPLLESAFNKNKMAVVVQEREGNHGGPSWQQGAMEDNWSILMCLNNTERRDNCVVTAHQTHQKVNTIPELTEALLAPQLLCLKTKARLGATPQRTGFLFGSPLKCDNGIQHQHEILKKKLASCDSTFGWWVNNAGSTTLHSLYLPCKEDNLPEFLLNKITDSSVIISLPKNLMTVDGSSPFVWQLEILVTSLSPTRFYIHPNGLTWDGLHGYSGKKQQKNVSLMDLRQLINDLAGEEAAITTLSELNEALLKFMKLVEQLGSTRAGQRFCERCFQIMEALVIFNSTFHPFILQVTPFNYIEQLRSVSDYLIEQSLLEDLAVMLVSRESVALGIASGLSAFGITQVKLDLICSGDNKICLNKQQVSYLLDTRREQRALKNWIRIFPTNQKQHSNNNLQSSKDPFNHFEKLIMSMEQYFLGPEVKQDTKRLSEGHIKRNEIQTPRPAYFSDIHLDLTDGVLLEGSCDNDTSSLPYLSAIQTVPLLRLYPLFSPLTTEYHAYVDHSTTIIQILGIPKHCKTLVRLEDSEENRLNNFIIGIGENTAHLLVTDFEKMEPLSTYKVVIHRKSADQSFGKFDSNLSPHQVCQIKQDCSLLITPAEPCGLHQAQFDKWDNFLTYQMSLPQCGDDESTGQWLVPCTNCSEINSCYWKNSVWYQEGCREIQLSKKEIQNCLFGKKVLFIGDSTNRGIQHYISERLNGSLMEWDKTHTIRVYEDLNEGRTVFGFAYYPQFWLPHHKRPPLDKALAQLIKRTPSTLKLVIVLGGVHWLSRRHIDMILSCLQREGLKDYKVMVKGLGAGFHHPVSGVHQLSQEDHQKLYLHNEAVLAYARSKSFSIVDTFSMTMARFKDFMPGKCACHFHKVVPFGQSILNKLSHRGLLPTDYHTKYHVEGEINAVYSEMVINRLCSKG